MIMSERNKTEITIETERTFIVRRRPSCIWAWCEGCRAAAAFAPPEDAARLAGRSARDIYRAVEADRLHFIESGDGRLRVCLNSLLPAGAQAIQVVDMESSDAGWSSGEQGFALPLTEVMSETVFEIVHPDGSTSRKKSWTLTGEAFEALLASLDADRERAARRYEAIRARLLKFFECRGCPSPEDLADDTFNRVARRLVEGRRIWAAEPASYFYGVARNVLREYWGAPERGIAALDGLPPPAHPYIDPLKQREAEGEQGEAERRLDRLAACLAELPAESRELILDYYRGERRERIRNRKAMAERLGIPPNALRIRVHRIRERLERSFGEPPPPTP